MSSKLEIFHFFVGSRYAICNRHWKHLIQACKVDKPNSYRLSLDLNCVILARSFIIFGVASQIPHFCVEDSAITLKVFPSIIVKLKTWEMVKYIP